MTIDRERNRKILLIHGNNHERRAALSDFLRAINLIPLESITIVNEIGSSTPPIARVLEQAFEMSQVAVVLLTPDEEVYLRRNPQVGEQEETQCLGQVSHNVLIELGMSLVKYPDRTVLVQLGQVRLPSHLEGRSIIHLNNESACRHELAESLRVAGCDVRTNGKDWLSTGDFSPPTLSPVSDNAWYVDGSYLEALKFAKLIHHEFHEFDHQGWHDVGVAARALFKTTSPGNKHSLVETIQDKWATTRDARESIDESVLNPLSIHVEAVQVAFQSFNGNLEDSIYKMITESFKAIKDSLEKKYVGQISGIQDCLDENGNLDHLDDFKVNKFVSEAMALDRTVDRLVSKADAMIKNLIGAIENDCGFRQ